MKKLAFHNKCLIYPKYESLNSVRMYTAYNFYCVINSFYSNVANGDRLDIPLASKHSSWRWRLQRIHRMTKTGIIKRLKCFIKGPIILDSECAITSTEASQVIMSALWLSFVGCRKGKY